MTLTTVILLILIGLLIILAEIFFVPGSTVVGVVGIILVLVGLVGGFYSLDREIGLLLLAGTLVLLGGLTYLGFKTRTWQRFAVKSSIRSKADPKALEVHVGDEGVTLTRCTPIGKVQFQNVIEEVYSSGDFLDANVKVVITKILDKKIIVKPLTTTV